MAHALDLCEQCGATDDHPKFHLADGGVVRSYHHDCLSARVIARDLDYAPRSEVHPEHSKALAVVEFARNGLRGDALREHIVSGRPLRIAGGATSGIDATTGALVLAAMNGGTALSIAAPLKVLWLTAVRAADNGTDTEVATSAGYTAGTGFSGLTFAAATTSASGAAQASSNAATITNMPACTWVGNKIVDSSGSPKTTFWATLTASKTVNAGDTVSIASGNFQTTLS